MNLSAHFTLEELTTTEVRRFLAEQAKPPPEVLENLERLADRLEIVRALLGHRPVRIHSGWRCPGLNRAVGGAKASAHLVGLAADFTCRSFGPPLAICRQLVAESLVFDQLIEEGTWVHVSFDPRMRGQVLSKAGDGALRRGLP